MELTELFHYLTYLISILLFILGGLALRESPPAFLIVVGTSGGIGLIIAGIIWWCLGLPPFLIEYLYLKGKFSEETEKLINENDSKIPLVYRPEYNITAFGLEKLHPFDSCKYGRVITSLEEKGLIKPDKIYKPKIVTHQQLLLVHTKRYLASLHNAWILTKIIEVPIILLLPVVLTRRRVLIPMQYQVGGTILAAKLALSCGYAINIGGGFHHASAKTGGGFCVYADITICIHYLRKIAPEKMKKVMIIDLDAHQGNGHERDFLGDSSVYILDFFNPFIYPNDIYAKQAIAESVEIAYNTSSDETYLPTLKKTFQKSLNSFRPSFIVYNAGTDCMRGDPLGRMQLTAEGIKKRDEIVFQEAFSRNIPILMVLSGGYQMSNAQCIADSIENLHEKFQICDITRNSKKI